MALVVSRLHDFLSIGDSASACRHAPDPLRACADWSCLSRTAEHLLHRALSVLTMLHDPSSPDGDVVQFTPENVAAALRLFQHHVDRRRRAGRATPVTAPYEVLVASYVEAMASFEDDATSWEASLAGSVRKVSVEEYAAAMEGVAEELAGEEPETKKSRALIRVASVLLRHASGGESSDSRSDHADGLAELSHVARRYLPVFIALSKEAAAATQDVEALRTRAAFVEEICRAKVSAALLRVSSTR